MRENVEESWLGLFYVGIYLEIKESNDLQAGEAMPKARSE